MEPLRITRRRLGGLLVATVVGTLSCQSSPASIAALPSASSPSSPADASPATGPARLPTAVPAPSAGLATQESTPLSGAGDIATPIATSVPTAAALVDQSGPVATVSSVTVAPAASTSVTGLAQGSAAGRLSQLPLIFPVQSTEIAAFFNQIAHPGDIAMIPSRMSASLVGKITAGQKLILFTSWADASPQLDGLRGKVDLICYDPEHWDQTPKVEQENLVSTVKSATAATHARGLSLLVAPDRTFDDEFLGALAPGVDVLLLQAQRLQDNPSAFASWTRRSIGVARTSNPNIRIFVQVGASRGTAGEMVAALQSVAYDIDGIAAWSLPRSFTVLQDFVSQIRPRPASS